MDLLLNSYNVKVKTGRLSLKYEKDLTKVIAIYIWEGRTGQQGGRGRVICQVVSPHNLN